MKTILALSLSVFSAYSAFASPISCTTADGMKFSAVYNMEREDLCSSDYLIINGEKIAAPAGTECSELSSFEGSEGTKLSISANGLGTLFYKGKIVAVNCSRR